MLKSKIVKELKNFWNDEDAQGMMEYILLAVLVVGAVALLKEPITNAIQSKSTELTTEISEF